MKASSGTRAVVVDIREATTVECFLYVLLSVLGFVPSNLQQAVLLVFIQGQTSTGHRKLHDKHYEQDYHVEEKQDLVVFQGAAQPHKGHHEEERAHAEDSRHHPDAGDQAEPFPPGCHPDQQQTHQNIKNIESAERILGANEPAANHRCSETAGIFPGVLGEMCEALRLLELLGRRWEKLGELPAEILRADLTLTHESLIVPRADDCVSIGRYG